MYDEKEKLVIKIENEMILKIYWEEFKLFRGMFLEKYLSATEIEKFKNHQQTKDETADAIDDIIGDTRMGGKKRTKRTNKKKRTNRRKHSIRRRK